ncbi:MAG: S8 family serine peptidase [Leptolyngbyaceae bacterium]|nr:S8 family serine peptidase [Leptolyngbyaceae bacterium]
MYSYKYGGQNGTTQNLVISDECFVVRTADNQELDTAVDSPSAKNLLPQLKTVTAHREAGVFVVKPELPAESSVEARDRARQILNQEHNIRFAGRVLVDPESGMPTVYTENFFVKFHDNVDPQTCESVLQNYHLTIKKQQHYAKNAYFVGAPDGTGLEIFQIAERLLKEPTVELCHPELIRENRRRRVPPLQQWHLRATTLNGQMIEAHVNVEDAWKVTQGKGVTIAVVDDGFDIDHPEFKQPDKVLHPRDVTLGIDDARPKDPHPQYKENHGTACAGVACASGDDQAFGVAPEATLMPIRFVSGLGSQAETDAFVWAVDHGADIISCSWGPADGPWWDPSDPIHQQVAALPDSTRLALDYAVTHGRDGKGCVITWAAGNGNESVDNDGYASYEKVIAVAACNDSNRRSVYSDFGKAIWCTFPSSDFGYGPLNHPEPKTSGIWTTDRFGADGYNPGELNPNADLLGDQHGHYTDTFGGTSSACPGVAGIAALILAVNPDLKWDEVKTILRQAAVKIDEAAGEYDEDGHSPFYGYGRPDPSKAVAIAQSLCAETPEEPDTPEEPAEPEEPDVPDIPEVPDTSDEAPDTGESLDKLNGADGMTVQKKTLMAIALIVGLVAILSWTLSLS